jgi:EmrB/QacA subfamily drug resistance transporter
MAGEKAMLSVRRRGGAQRVTAPPRDQAAIAAALFWPTAMVLASGVMSAMNGSIVNTALPTLTRVFTVTPATIAWITIAQALTTATLLTVFGRLSDMTGRKRIYMLGLAISVAASALSGLSVNVEQLIACRVVHGVGSAMVVANSLAYLVEIHPSNRRGFVLGIFEAAIAIGLAAGPAVGGLLLSAFGWRSIFFVHVIAGAVILLMVPRVMVEPPRELRRQTFDFAGAILFAGALAPLMFALTQGHDLGWTSPPVLACLSVSAASLAAFIATELRIGQPMLELDMFRSLSFSAGNLAKVCGYFGFSATIFLLPFYWDRALQLPPARLGLALTAFPTGLLVGSMVFGTLSDRIGTRLLAPGGLVVLAGASVIQMWMTSDMGVWPVLVAATLAGLGVGAFIAPNDSAILAVTPKERLGVANGVMGVSRSLGSLFGQAAAAGLLTARLAAHDGDFLSSYHEVFALVVLVTLLGAGLAAVRDPA